MESRTTKTLKATLCTLAIVALSGCVRHNPYQQGFAPQVVTSGTVTSGTIPPTSVTPAQVTTDCSTLIPDIWHAQGFYDEPMDRTAAELQNGDACTNPFLPGPKKRETPQ